MFKTEFLFALPKGFVDKEGNVHKEGIMRLATAADEIHPMRDRRVQDNPGYLTVLLLSRVITNLGTIENVKPEEIEKLFTVDFNYLQEFYTRINQFENPNIETECPHCGKNVEVALDFLGNLGE